MTADGSMAFGQQVSEHLARVERHNDKELDALTHEILDVSRSGGVIHTAGTGHSLALVQESFYRAGGLACVNPIYHPGLLPLSGSAPSTVMERSSGLATTLVARASPQAGESAVVFSNSGINHVPVELAQQFAARDVRVTAVTSVTAATDAPARAGQKLHDIADHVLDTLVPPGDVAFPAAAPVTGALSSLVSVFLWQTLLARVVQTAQAGGVELPLWRSNNAPGGEEHNAELLTRYRERVAAL